MFVFTKTGRVYTLERTVGKKKEFDVTLGLFVNNITPKINNTLKMYKELFGFGYEPRILWDSWWEVKLGKLIRPSEIFEFMEKVGKVYGYFVSADEELIGAEKFSDGPYNVDSGDKIIINCSMM